MNDDYLWDKSGQPDPDIVELEEILGTLRYKPRALEIPADIHPGRRFTFNRGLAIAAAVALVALGLGVWLGWQRQQAVEFVQTNTPAPVQNSNQASAIPSNQNESHPAAQIQAHSRETVPEAMPTTSRRQQVSSNKHRARHIEPKQPLLSESEIAEARAAKDQLMMALRLASTKLNLVQKKTRGVGSDTEIHNQHKIG